MSTPRQIPDILSKSINALNISWKTLNKEDTKFDCILQQKDEFRVWKTVYRGRKARALVESLQPCTLYEFRLKKDDEDWLYFKSSTDFEPPFVWHMMKAINFCRPSEIRKIVSKKQVLLDGENKQGKTPLIELIEMGDYQMVHFLVNLGASINRKSRITAKTPLMYALHHGRKDMVELFLSKDVDTFAMDINLLTTMHYAVDSNCVEVVDICLQHGCDVDPVDSQGWTPLLRADAYILAIFGISEQIIMSLIQNGADVMRRDKNGFDFRKLLELNDRHLSNEVWNYIETDKKQHVATQENNVQVNKEVTEENMNVDANDGEENKAESFT